MRGGLSKMPDNLLMSTALPLTFVETSIINKHVFHVVYF